MKILRVTATINPESGGVAESILQMARAARLCGHTVEVVCIDDPDAAFITASDITVHAMGRGLLNYRLQPKLLGWLGRHAKNYDAIIIDGIWQFHSVAAHHVLTRMHIPYHVFTHGMLAPWFKHTHPFKHLKKWLYWRIGDFRVLRDARAVLFTCEAERLGARQSFAAYQANEKVVGLGVARQEIDNQQAAEKFLEKFPALRGKKIVLCLCRIHPIKGIDLLIQAFANTLSANQDYHLVIAGPGDADYVNALKQLAMQCGISAQLTWTGMISGDDKTGAYAASEVFMLPSHHENFSLVVVEALSFGLPVLISDQVNIWHEIIDAKAGFSAADTLEGAEALLKKYLAMEPDMYAQISQNARQCFLDKFESGQALNNLLGVLQSP